MRRGSSDRRLQRLRQHLCSSSSDDGGAQPANDEQLLAGVRVVELATVIAAPSACAIMADHGADIIKVKTHKFTRKTHTLTFTSRWNVQVVTAGGVRVQCSCKTIAESVRSVSVRCCLITSIVPFEPTSSPLSLCVCDFLCLSLSVCVCGYVTCIQICGKNRAWKCSSSSSERLMYL